MEEHVSVSGSPELLASRRDDEQPLRTSRSKARWFVLVGVAAVLVIGSGAGFVLGVNEQRERAAGAARSELALELVLDLDTSDPNGVTSDGPRLSAQIDVTNYGTEEVQVVSMTSLGPISVTSGGGPVGPRSTQPLTADVVLHCDLFAATAVPTVAVSATTADGVTRTEVLPIVARGSLADAFEGAGCP